MVKKDIGFYQVGEKEFTNKLDAVLEAQKTDAKVEWNFFDSTFNKVDWESEPQTSLDELYKIRAEQIRSLYDYIIVFCSGGADSTNVIKTFINNGIKVDEVIGIAPMSGLKNWEYDSSNVADLNIVSETKFALLPLLDELSSKHNIKVTLYDFFEDILKYNDEEWTFEAAGNIVTLLTTHFTNIDKIPHINKLIESGKKIALVYGGDKPIIKINPAGEMLTIFSDAGTNMYPLPSSRTYANVDRVLFYWTPDLTDMLVKQAHVVARAILSPGFSEIYKSEILLSRKDMVLVNASYQNMIEFNPSLPSKEDIFKKYISTKTHYYTSSHYTSSRAIYQRAIIPFIYPSTYTKNLWQVQKIDVKEGFFTRDQDWLHILHPGSRVSQMILSGNKQLYDAIKPKYLNHKGTGFNHISKFFKFGNIENYQKSL